MTQTTLRCHTHTATITFTPGPATQWLLGIADELKQSKGPIMAERCVSCGKFVSYSEMKQGGGASFYFEPLNEFGPEVSEWTCSQCNQQSKGRECGLKSGSRTDQ